MGIIGVIGILPLSLAMKLGEQLGKLGYLLDKRHRQVALNNLQKAFAGEKTPEQLREIAQGSFINLGRFFVEFCRFFNLKEEELNQWLEIEGWENFERASRQGKGVLVVAAHFGNWELMGAATALRGYPCNLIVRPLDNIFLDKIVTSNRVRFGNRLNPKKRVIPKLIQCLRRGEIVAVLMDQSTAPNEAVLANFFGHPCYTLVTPALLALKTDCALLPVFMVRQEKYKHKLIIAPEVIPVRSDDRQHDLEVNTQRLNDVIEEYVRKYPDHWLWLHRRWKF